MMKKIYVMLAVAALVFVSSMAFAADIKVSGSMDFRSRDFQNLDLTKNVSATGDKALDTQERVRLNVDVKADDVSGRVTIENDWDDWGRLETKQANGATTTSEVNQAGSFGNKSFLNLREAWMAFTLPGTGIGVKGGHQLLQLGQGWWFRSMKYGSDSWLLHATIDKLLLAFVDVKVAEGAVGASDDIDAYVLLGMLTIDENNKIGIDITDAYDRRASLSAGWGLATNPFEKIDLQNIGLNYTGKLGPVNLKAEVDVQMGKATAVTGGQDAKFKGSQVVVQGSVPVEPVTINFTVASGSGQKFQDTSNDVKQYVPILDADPHYTFLYEYKVANKGAVNLLNGNFNGDVHLGFANTTAIGAGAMFAATNDLSLGADLWYLQATEKVADVTTTDPNDTTNELGLEVDLTINWKLAENLTWNWSLGYLDPGKGLGKDAATGAQGILSMKF
jgi:hypothetical protein